MTPDMLNLPVLAMLASLVCRKLAWVRECWPLQGTFFTLFCFYQGLLSGTAHLGK